MSAPSKLRNRSKVPRYMAVCGSQILANPEYFYFLSIGWVTFILFFSSLNLWIALLAVVTVLVAALVSIANTVGTIDKAFESLPMDFNQGYGSPLWIVEGKYPLANDTLRINAAGYGESSFEKYREIISSRLSQPIQRISKPTPSKPIIEVKIKKSELQKELLYRTLNPSELSQGEFFVGQNETKLVKLSIAEAIHILIGGQTGSGKTQFLRQMIATILGFTRYSHVCLLDMKEGVDFPAFEGLPNFEIASTFEEATIMLDRVNELFQIRKQILKEKKKENWRLLTLSELENEGKLAGLPIGPVLVVVDELADLARQAGKRTARIDLQDRIARIAQLARFTGIHLIIGTQRPDKSVLLGQSKDTIPTRICFSVPSVTASTLVLGDMTASTIGNHPGRAVFQFQGNEIVQTPYLPGNEVISMMDAVRIKLQTAGYKRGLLSRKTQAAQIDKPRISE